MKLVGVEIPINEEVACESPHEEKRPSHSTYQICRMKTLVKVGLLQVHEGKHEPHNATEHLNRGEFCVESHKGSLSSPLLRFGGSNSRLVDEAYEFSGLIFGGFFVGGEAALGEIVGDGMTVGAADLHGDGELLHDAYEFGFGDGRGQDGEVGEVVGDVGRLGRACRLLGCQGETEEEYEGAGDSFMAAPGI
jgi:hypothetical protein